jgi:hypothetical protein
MRWLLILSVAVLAVALIAFNQQRLGVIRGRVVPQNGALNVWAVSAEDTGHTLVQNGEFEIKHLRPGRYHVMAEGRKPYKLTIRPDVVLNDSSIVDIGDLILDQ